MVLDKLFLIRDPGFMQELRIESRMETHKGMSTDFQTVNCTWKHIHVPANSPRLSRSLGDQQIPNQSPTLLTGHQISQIKSTFELSCALVWNSAQNWPIVWFLGYFCAIFYQWQILFGHYNQEWILVGSNNHVRVNILS